MEAKLVKEYGDFYLISDKEIKKGDEYVKLDNRPRTLLLGTTISHVTKVSKLSLKNCQAIERGYDLDELAISTYPFDSKADVINAISQQAYIKGFQKCLEILGDRKFVVKEFLDTWFDVDDTLIGDPVWVDSQGLQVITPKQLNNLYQKTEWEVEIVEDTDCTGEFKYLLLDKVKPKLDAEGNLILKRK